MSGWITSGKEVKEAVEDGWELWHVSPDMMPGRWEIRRGREIRRVHWDAIERIRQHYRNWFKENTETRQEGQNTWAYLPRQRNLRLPS